MRRAAHGGQCCGMDHISGFEECNEDNKNELQRKIDEIKRHRPGGCIECVLIDQQLSGEPRQERIYGGMQHNVGGWGPHLHALGFRLVHRFRNSNHGNWCNVFHLAYGQPARPRAQNFDWPDPIPPVAAPERPAEIREVARAIPGEVREAAARALGNRNPAPSTRVIAEWIRGQAR